MHESLQDVIRRAEQAIKALSSCVLDGLKPGAYAFFNHNAHVLSALQDCWRIYDRLCSGREQLTDLANQEHRLTPNDWPAGTTYPEEVQAIMRQSGDITEHMKLDMESLYIFGGILLDQWAMQAIAVGNIPCPKQHPFRELVDYLDQNPNGKLEPVWIAARDDMLWLYYQLRLYRNRFIVHANRPWQRGTTRSVYGDDFNLFTPTPPGWLDDKAVDAEIMSLLQLAPERIRNASHDYWEKTRPGRLLEVLFDNITQYPKEDREKISRLFGQKGGSTPNFQVLAGRIFRFVARATPLLTKVAQANLQSIDIGRPHRTSEEMWRDRETGDKA
jgi:hypothetical protein